MRLASIKIPGEVDKLMKQYIEVTARIPKLKILDLEDGYVKRDLRLSEAKKTKALYEKIFKRARKNKTLMYNNQTQKFVVMLNQAITHRIECLDVAINHLKCPETPFDCDTFDFEIRMASKMDEHLIELIRGGFIETR